MRSRRRVRSMSWVTWSVLASGRGSVSHPVRGRQTNGGRALGPPSRTPSSLEPLRQAVAEAQKVWVGREVVLTALEEHLAGLAHADLVADLGVHLPLAADDVVVA